MLTRQLLNVVNIKKEYKNQALSVFLRPPSFEILVERLKKRSTEVEHQLEMRLKKAEFEMQYESQYDVVLINDKLEVTLQQAEELVLDFINS